MITISRNRMNQVEYLIGQSIQGNHILFDLDTLRRVFWNDTLKHRSTQLTDEQAYCVEHHIEKLITQPTLAEKRAYLEQLPPETLEHVVRTYFNIVENNIYENMEIRHS